MHFTISMATHSFTFTSPPVPMKRYRHDVGKALPVSVQRFRFHRSASRRLNRNSAALRRRRLLHYQLARFNALITQIGADFNTALGSWPGVRVWLNSLLPPASADYSVFSWPVAVCTHDPQITSDQKPSEWRACAARECLPRELLKSELDFPDSDCHSG